MSPDLEWRVDDPAGEQTIAKMSTPQPPRWRKWVIGVVVMLGIGLGLLYRSIPEPARPVPTPTIIPSPPPTAMPAALYNTIAREAQALADGDQAAFKQLLDVQDFTRYTELTNTLKPWGTPTDSALYVILDFRLTAQDKAWTKIKQFQVDHYIQEVRFYHLRNGEWRRTDFDPSFWSGSTETNETPHFQYNYFVEDYALIEPIAAVLEADYEQLCSDFDCPTTPMTCMESFGHQWCSAFTRTLTVTLDLRGRIQKDATVVTDTAGLVFDLSSPRLARPLDSADLPHYIRNPITWLEVMHLAYGAATPQEPPPPGRALVIAIFFREFDRLSKRTGDPALDLPADFKHIDIRYLLSLDSIWQEVDASNMPQIILANAIVEFVDQEFGPQAVARLLKATGPSKSLAEAIETSTGISYVAFEERWRAWVMSNASTTP